jgi:hypothetical protein
VCEAGSVRWTIEWTHGYTHSARTWTGFLSMILALDAEECQDIAPRYRGAMWPAGCGHTITHTTSHPTSCSLQSTVHTHEPCGMYVAASVTVYAAPHHYCHTYIQLRSVMHHAPHALYSSLDTRRVNKHADAGQHRIRMSHACSELMQDAGGRRANAQRTAVPPVHRPSSASSRRQRRRQPPVGTVAVCYIPISDMAGVDITAYGI